MEENELELELYKYCEEIANEKFPKSKIKYIKKRYHSPKGRERAIRKDILDAFPLVALKWIELKSNNLSWLKDVETLDIGEAKTFSTEEKPSFFHVDLSLEDDNKQWKM